MSKEINEYQKWPTDKKRYDRNYLRYHGKVCPKCNGDGEARWHKQPPHVRLCALCNGLGYVEREKKCDCFIGQKQKKIKKSK